jgi:hypothetical protein
MYARCVQIATDAQKPTPKNFEHLPSRQTAEIAQTQIASVVQKYVAEVLDN